MKNHKDNGHHNDVTTTSDQHKKSYCLDKSCHCGCDNCDVKQCQCGCNDCNCKAQPKGHCCE